MSARLWQLDPWLHGRSRKQRLRKWLKRTLNRAERRARKEPEVSTDRAYKGYSS